MWALRGLRNGVLTTRWPDRPDDYAAAARGEHGGWPPGAGRVVVRPGGPPGGEHAVTQPTKRPHLTRHPASPPVPAHPVDVTGAGDAMISGTLYRLLAGEPLASAVRVGSLLAAMTTENDATVHPELSPRFLGAAMSRIRDYAGARAS